MCRNIRPLFNFDPPSSPAEVQAAAIQYVRKVSGSTKPSQANQVAFDDAVEKIGAATRELLVKLVTTAAPKNRDIEWTKQQARNKLRFSKAP